MSKRTFLFGTMILLILMLVFRPQGIFGDRREIALQDR